LIYSIIKPIISATIWLFCKKLFVVNKAAFQQKGPLLIVANHPNSFLDAVLIGAFFKEEVHFLARGDAFKNKLHRFLLKFLNMIPIYRLREGKENLHLNEYAFHESKRILENGGIVLIFIEGICLNTNDIQPFKKGAARIAYRSKPPQPLRILPIALAYDTFNRFGKTVLINAGNGINASALFPYEEESKNYLFFNKQLKSQIEELVSVHPAIIKNKKTPVELFAKFGKILHLPYYSTIKKFVQTKTAGTVFYDSVLFGVLMFTYPLYLILLSTLLFTIGLSFNIILAVLIVHILSAKVAVLQAEVK
jgi:1-acyl-sn-glycerol-3-phosphate acyltransferase